VPFAEETLAVRVKSTGVDGFKSEIDEAAAAVGGFRNAAALAGGALGAIGFAAATKAAADFESQMIEVEKVTSAATADELSSSLQELATRVPVAVSELSNIAEIAGRLGIEGSDNINQFTETVSKMAVATNLNAEDAANALARLSNALGTPIEESEMMASVINELSNNVAASSDEIVDSMTRAAPAAGQLGVKFQDLAAIQSTLIASGMQVERAGTRVNRMLTKMAQESATVADQLGMTEEEFVNLIDESPREALMRVVESLSEIDSSAERLQVADQIFGAAGAKAANALAQNVDGLRDSLGMANEEAKEADSIQAEFETAVQSTKNQFQLLVNEIGNFGRQTGSNFLPLVKLAIGGLRGLIGILNAANKATNGWLGTIAITGLVIGGAIVAIGLLSGVVTGTLIPAFWSGIGTLNVFNISLGTTAGLALSVIGLILLLAGVIAALATNFGGFRDKAIASLVAVEVGFRAMWAGLKNSGKAAINAVTQFFADGMNFIIEKFNAVIKQYNRLRELMDKDPIQPFDTVEGTDFEMTNIREEFSVEEELNEGLLQVGEDAQEKYGSDTLLGAPGKAVEDAFADLPSPGELAGGGANGEGEGLPSGTGEGGVGEMSKEDFMEMGFSEERAKKFAQGNFGAGGEGKSIQEKLNEQKAQLEEDTAAAKEQSESAKELLNEVRDGGVAMPPSETAGGGASEPMPDDGRDSGGRTPSDGDGRRRTGGRGGGRAITPSDIRRALAGTMLTLSGTLDVSGDVANMDDVRAFIKANDDAKIKSDRRKGVR